MADRTSEIVDAAITIAAERGLDAVSMRSVAERVGVTPMALYPHVGSKSALLDAMIGTMLAELRPALTAGPTWRERLRELARAGRRLTQLHPWLAPLLFSRPSVAPDAVRVTDAIYVALLEAGVPASAVPRVERLVSTFVVGYGASEAGGRFGTGPDDPRATRGNLPEGQLPGHRRLAAWLASPPDRDAEFEADLADLERLIEILALSPAATAASRGGPG